ncbi:MAG: ArsR family transcriptional regulator [Nitrosopumilales archaeon CG15_BIG_FIL_POST_REV_8_21_14_020_33_23]|nr:MAG: ArsR family transcriptional regulator [Nitrosopumilales archaeon CG11_big_fil_rev_8_21_14_0_20_33_24]PIW34496.1 MAG: ArsR family transcriptional regulator [Nitrosopumilales archaeon CG15_BIG_FIL_POST_REV_8_21_14_020_33_23]PIY89936.1 MAG: ArsR family transcriptional regulator [Nitrosopumilales archaeon CG_4_10_14_0_8_um_filter_34_8]
MSDVNFKTDNSVNVFSLDDVKMKILAKVISNKSSIEILNLLFYSEMTANEIAQKTNMSLQLVKHYLGKMQQIELIHVSKTEKNSKARNMNYYKASKIAIVITPSKITEKTKQSKSLVRSFHSISKFFGMGIVSAITALSLAIVSAESSLLNPFKSWYSDFSLPIKISGTGLVDSIDESLYMAKTKVDSVVSNPGAGSGTPYLDPYSNILDFTGADYTITMIVLAVIGAAISFAIFNKVIRSFQKNPSIQDSF